MLLWLVFLPLLGGFIGWLCNVSLQKSFTEENSHPQLTNKNISVLTKIRGGFCRHCSAWIALLTMLIVLVLTIFLSVDAIYQHHQQAVWIQSVDIEWIPLFGIRFHLVLDGLSLAMILLVSVITIAAILYSHKEKHNNTGLFYFCLLFMTSAVMMFFVAVDLFLVFFLWEAVAIPVYFLIALWGRRDSNSQLSINGASKFLIYTQVTSLILLISIVSLALINWKLTDHWTFDYIALMKTPISSYIEFLLMLGFLAAFIVRVPLIPFHGWFIDAHVESSTTGSIMISGLLVNTAIYGILRFIIPLFPNASLAFTPIILLLSIITLFYMAFLAFNQNDIKRVIAYAHIALASIITAMIYSGSLLAYQGIVLQLIAVSLSIVGLFIISGLLVERYSTRNIKQFIGLKNHVKYLSTLTLFFILAIFGVPGSANFVGHFMMFFGSYEAFSFGTIMFVIGLLLLSISIIIRMQPIFYDKADKAIFDKEPVSTVDLFLLIFILAVLVSIGLYPQWVLDMSYPTINEIQNALYNAQLDLIKGNI